VVRDEVEQQLQPALVRGGDQRVGVRERAEHRLDVGVVGDVVAEVLHRRAVDRRQPGGVDAEPGQVVEPRGDPAQVADPVAVGVGERARIDVVDDARGATSSCERRQPPLEQPALGVVVHERQRALVLRARLAGAPEPPQQLAARRVQVAVVVELEASTMRRPASGPSSSATATARLSSTTGEPVRRASSP
jgi:hypothetical protein